MGKQGGGRSLALAEIIISIGVLALVSVFILEMFVRASNITNKARDKDLAVFETLTVIETYKTHGRLDGLPDSVFSRDVKKISPTAYELYYTQDFTPAATRNDNGYTLVLTVTPSERVGDTACTQGVWESLTVSVVKLSPYLMADEESVEILRLNAGAYFPTERAVAS